MHVVVKTKRFDATPSEWLELAAQCGELTNKWSARGDVIAYVGQGAGMGIAAALWNPLEAEMELNVDQAFGEGAKPEFIGDLRDRDTQFEQPVACGAILHEAMHARHTHFDFAAVRDQKDKRVAGLVEWFEEIRIEARGVEEWPANRSFLRASALKLAVSDMKEAGEDAAKSNAMQLSKLLVLTQGRVAAGVLDDDDVKPVMDGARKVFSDKLLSELDKLMVRATQHKDDYEWKPLKKLAEKWIELLEDEGHKTQPSQEEKDAAAQAIAKVLADILGSDEGSGGSGGEDGEKTPGGSLDEMADEVETRARGEASDQASQEAAEEAAKAAAAAAREASDAEDAANKVFGKSTGDLPIGTASKSRLNRERPPTDDERGAAVTIAKMLERARYRDRVVVRRTSALPPGRLRSRAMVQAAAEESRGAMRTAEPWAAKRRYHTEDPMLRVGMMTDISGSMRSAMEPMAVANWVFSEAVRRVQGKVASVYYGNSVFPGLAPGDHLDKVKIYNAPDGTERFDMAFRALNGKLELLNSSGARLLVVVSDLYYTETERVAVRKWFGRCVQAGVGVLVLPFEASTYFEEDTVAGLPVKLLNGVGSPTKAALEIGQAAAEALEAAGNRA